VKRLVSGRQRHDAKVIGRRAPRVQQRQDGDRSQASAHTSRHSASRSIWKEDEQKVIWDMNPCAAFSQKG